MGLTKQYLRYVSSGICNVVASSSSNICLVDEKTCLVGACENVHLWDFKANKASVFPGSKSRVVVVKISPNKDHMSVGYSDGSIGIYELNNPNEPKVTFNGHKSSTSCLSYTSDGLLLSSGSKDCTAIVWDLVNESGLYKLLGHQAPITQCKFVKNDSLLVTSSKDSTIKFWDLSSQHCIYTLADHRSEVWDFVFLRQETQLIAGSAEAELTIFDVKWLQDVDSSLESTSDKLDTELQHSDIKKFKPDYAQIDPLEEGDQENNMVRIKKFGTILRKAKGRVTQLVSSLDEKLLICLGTGTLIDTYGVLTIEQTRERIKRKIRKLVKKSENNNDKIVYDENTVSRDVTTRFIRLSDLKLNSKPMNVDIIKSSISNNQYKLGVLFKDNFLDCIELKLEDKNLTVISTNDERRFMSHCKDVRFVKFSQDDTAFATCAQDGLKIWNKSSLTCVRTLPTSFSLDHKKNSNDANFGRQSVGVHKDFTAVEFIVGDRHVVVTDKAGKMFLYDVDSRNLIEEICAHDASISSLCFTSDQKSIITAGADKFVKFWDFELICDNDKKRLTLELSKSLELSDEVLCCEVTKNGKYLVVGLLDNTAKIYFVDTLKFFLCLYGHSLPVLCLDTSSDDTLVVTGSADKNVKIWGTDFGDCHKSLFAHDDSVTCVKFVPKTHLFFSAGKDGKIKQWDADKFEKILVISDHFGEIWSLDVSRNGKYVVSASSDQSIRTFEKTDEILVLEDEQEMEREVEYEKSVELQDDVVPGEASGVEVGLAVKRTLDTVKSADDLIDAIDIIRKEQENIASKEVHTQHPLIGFYGSTSLSTFLLDVVRKIKSSELEKSLLLIPFGYVEEVIQYLTECIEKNYNVELACRCVLFLIKVHHGTLMTSSNSMSVIDKLKNCCSPKIAEIRDTLGFNLAALKFLQLKLAEKKQVQLFAEAKLSLRQKRKKIKQLTEEKAYVIA